MTSPTAHVGVMLPRDLPAEQFVDFARRAEELGLDELWVVEDLGFRGGIAQAATALAVTARIPREWISSLAIAGNVDDVRDAIAARHAAGATTVVLTPVGDDPLVSLNDLARALPELPSA